MMVDSTEVSDLASEIARDSIVTKALSRFLTQFGSEIADELGKQHQEIRLQDARDYRAKIDHAKDENKKLRAAIQDAIEMLLERHHGNPARSPAHNARMCLQVALTGVDEPMAAEIKL
ncbi:hypothetical protein [Rhizobium laguerreae]|uniref:Uncharacterized protein n=1 Tax=Rhizobium laguerreae TaxID=1076926 RepID=A0A7Y2W8R1_9HYPH|nr:hypothetical protein [Rhizobium laguerreae]NNH67790.1 hypothetical protein [Rhizobium laguerreae]